MAQPAVARRRLSRTGFRRRPARGSVAVPRWAAAVAASVRAVGSAAGSADVVSSTGSLRARVVGFGGWLFGVSARSSGLFGRFVLGLFVCGLFVVGRGLVVLGLVLQFRWIRQRIIGLVQQAADRVGELRTKACESACGARQSATQVAERRHRGHRRHRGPGWRGRRPLGGRHRRRGGFRRGGKRWRRGRHRADGRRRRGRRARPCSRRSARHLVRCSSAGRGCRRRPEITGNLEQCAGLGRQRGCRGVEGGGNGGHRGSASRSPSPTEYRCPRTASPADRSARWPPPDLPHLS